MPHDIKVKTKTNPLDTLYLDFGRRVIESSTFCSSDERPKEFVASDDDDDDGDDDAQVSARSLAHVCGKRRRRRVGATSLAAGKFCWKLRRRRQTISCARQIRNETLPASSQITTSRANLLFLRWGKKIIPPM